MISNILKYIIFVIMFAITIYFYINKRNIGCRDKTALNYNSEVNIHDPIKCIFKFFLFKSLHLFSSSNNLFSPKQ